MYDVRRYYRTVSRFMDAELADRGDGALWCSVAQQSRPGLLLEIGCGSGRVTIQLAEAGARVVGIDLSPELIEIARRRLAGRANVWLLLADVRRLGLGARFAAIVAPDDPFSHLTDSDDRQRALSTVREHLAPGGRFVLDALWFPPGDERQGSSSEGWVREHDVTHQGRPLHISERWQCDQNTHVCSTRFDYVAEGGETAQARFEARYWTPGELRERLAAAGLQVTGWWGNYEREPWDEQRSRHLVVEAKAVHSAPKTPSTARRKSSKSIGLIR